MKNKKTKLKKASKDPVCILQKSFVYLKPFKVSPPLHVYSGFTVSLLPSPFCVTELNQHSPRCLDQDLEGGHHIASPCSWAPTPSSPRAPPPPHLLSPSPAHCFLTGTDCPHPSRAVTGSLQDDGLFPSRLPASGLSPSTLLICPGINLIMSMVSAPLHLSYQHGSHLRTHHH